MSKIAEKRTNEIIGEFHDGDYTDHSRHNTQCVAFKQGYDQAFQDFKEFIYDKFNIHPHDCHVVQYDSDTPLESMDDFVKQIENYIQNE